MVEKKRSEEVQGYINRDSGDSGKMGKVFFFTIIPKNTGSGHQSLQPVTWESWRMLRIWSIVSSWTELWKKEKLLKLFQDIDHGTKTVSAKIQSSGKDMVYQISMGRIQGGFTETTGICIGSDRTDQGRHTPE